MASTSTFSCARVVSCRSAERMELGEMDSPDSVTALVRPVGVSCSSVLTAAPLVVVPIPATLGELVVARSGVCEGV